MFKDPPPEYPGTTPVTLTNGNIPITSINITEEFNKSNIWKQVNEGNDKNNQTQQKRAQQHKSKQ